MKSIFTLFALAFFALTANAQISLSTPYTQDFEGTFTNGTRIEFLPGWFGNQIQPTAGAPRIHRDTLYPHAGRACLSALPTATVKDTIIVTYDMAGATSATMTFWAASDSAKTATGTRSAAVYYDHSIDGGIMYSAPAILGDSVRFPRNVTPYQQYTIPINGGGATGVFKTRFIVSRGAGLGTAARFLMDDVTITADPVATDRRADTHSLQILPNPNNGVFQIKLQNSALQTADIQIFDAVGRQVFAQKAVNINDFTMPNRLETGLYNIVLRAENQVFTQHLVVK